MDISKSSLIVFVLMLITNEGDAQSLSCGQSAGVPTLGLPFELNCTLSGQVTAYYGVSLKKANVSFMQIPFFESNSNATFLNDGASGRHSALVTVSPGDSRTVTVKISTLECIDNGDYNWEISFYTTETTTLRQKQTLTLKVVPQFGSEDRNNITISPATNLVEGDTVTFTCQGDVGNTPVGNLSWFYYLNGSTTAEDVSSKATAGAPQDSTVAGRTCSKTRVSTLTLTLTKEMHWFVVRCTVNQDQPFNAVGQGYKMTQQIAVMYKPTISSLRKVPDASQYTDGDPLLTLSCTATSNPAPEYYWTYESNNTNRTQLGVGNQLMLRNLTLNSKGVYTCVAYNLIKGVNQTTNASTEILVVERTTPAPTTPTTPSTTGTRPASGSPVTDPSTGGKNNTDSNTGAIIGGVIGCAALIIIIIIVVCCIRKNKKPKEIEEPSEKPRKPDLVSSENNLRNNMALNSSFNNSFDSTDHIKQRDDGLTYIDLQFDNKPGSRRPIQLYDNNSGGTQYADINLGSLPRV
ncbi:tyrosine-protein phosphatase non-receptor type substrate 1-like isoform X2 [Dreissena polymorpha]|nr:tyrosine-protein phosphatase non-receptor type substrate 1-like isoform X2 [Dreissena polymorpha]